MSTGLFGTNDNDAGNDFPMFDGSQAKNLEDFLYTWQVGSVRLINTWHRSSSQKDVQYEIKPRFQGFVNQLNSTFDRKYNKGFKVKKDWVRTE